MDPAGVMTRMMVWARTSHAPWTIQATAHLAYFKLGTFLRHHIHLFAWLIFTYYRVDPLADTKGIGDDDDDDDDDSSNNEEDMVF